VADNQESNERQKEHQFSPCSISEPLLQRIVAAIEAHAKAAEGEPKNGSEQSKPLFVQEVGGDDLEPFEEQTIAISRETLIVSRRGYRIALYAFAAAALAAGFVFMQVKVMSYQTQIMASQSESAAAGAIENERNTRKQLVIAQQQAQAAQDSVGAIRKQMRQDQRAWIDVHIKGMEKPIENRPVEALVSFNNTGKTPAIQFHMDVVVEIVPTERGPKFNYSVAHRNSIAGYVFQNTAPVDARFFVQHYGKRKEIVDDLLSHADYEMLMSGDSYLAVYALLKYKDIFGVQHWAQICAWHSWGDKGVPQDCTRYNRVDEN
jgi:hypothetical protein